MTMFIGSILTGIMAGAPCKAPELLRRTELRAALRGVTNVPSGPGMVGGSAEEGKWMP